MPRGVKKENLPTKICVVCGRPYAWRKKWERAWDEVTTCSRSCNRRRKGRGARRDEDDEDDDDYDDGGGGGEGVGRKTTIGDGRDVDDALHGGGEDHDCELESLVLEFGNMTHDPDARPIPNNNNINNNNNNNTNAVMKLAVIAALAGSSAAFAPPSPASRASSHAAAAALDADDLNDLGDLTVDADVVEIERNLSLMNNGVDIERSASSPPPSTTTTTDDDDVRSRRKAEKKRKKAERRAHREGCGDPAAGRKPCFLCGRSVDLLVRCTHDESGVWVS
jgi:hypothetical protein